MDNISCFTELVAKSGGTLQISFDFEKETENIIITYRMKVRDEKLIRRTAINSSVILDVRFPDVMKRLEDENLNVFYSKLLTRDYIA